MHPKCANQTAHLTRQQVGPDTCPKHVSSCQSIFGYFDLWQVALNADNVFALFSAA